MVADNRNNASVWSTQAAPNGNDGSPTTVDYERAVSLIGYGSFNVLLFLAALPIAWAGIFDTTTGAFILASAECDLNLTFIRKGILVATPFAAAVLTSFLWDYVTPFVGTRNLFVLALLADSLLNILSSAVNSYYVFLLIKFLCGILAGGPLASAMGYLTEFHSSKYKPRFTSWAGFLFAIANIIPAVLGFTILPLTWNVDVFGFNYNAWRVYLLICSIVPVVGLLTACMLPESPKFLLEIGRHEEALKLLSRMYAMNTRQPIDTFPIKALLGGQNPTGPQLSRTFLNTASEKIRVSWYNTKLLFSTRYLPAVSFLCILQFGCMLGFNTMRLWVPHLFVILNNFDEDHWNPADRAATMCEMLNRRAAIPARPYLNCTYFDDACLEWVVRPVIYQNSTIIATSAVLFSFLAGMIINTRFRRTLILLASFLISVVSGFGINWAQSPPYMLTLAAAIIVTSRIAGNVVTAVNADVIPIPLRATCISLLTTLGNLGAVIGNLIFSALLEIDCLSAFFGLGCLFSACFCLSFFQPRSAKTSPKNLSGPEPK